MTPERFEALVRVALEQLPEMFREHLDNVSVVIEARPSPELIRSMGGSPDDPEHTLFGLYEGIPLTERRHDDLLLPDQITIFREPLLDAFPAERDVIEEIRVTVLHEIGHFFGMDEEKLEELGYG